MDPPPLSPPEDVSEPFVSTCTLRAGRKVKAYLFNGYWEDIGTIKSFFDANLALAQDPPKFEFFDPEGPIVTSPRFLPPAKLQNCKIEESIISHGAFARNSMITSSVIGLRSLVRSFLRLMPCSPRLGASCCSVGCHSIPCRALVRFPPPSSL